MFSRKTLLGVVTALAMTAGAAHGASVDLTFSTYNYDFGNVEIGDTRTYTLTSTLDLNGNQIVAIGSTPTTGGLKEISGGGGWSCSPIDPNVASSCTPLTIVFAPLSAGISTLLIDAGLNYSPCNTCVVSGFFSFINFQGNGIEPTSTVPIPAALPLLASGLGVLGFVSWRRQRKSSSAAAV